MKVWVVRAGEERRYWPIFIERSEVGISFGWQDREVDPRALDRKALAAAARERRREDTEASLASQVGQTWAFIHEMKLGDLVIVPGPQGRTLAVARVTGAAEHAVDEELSLVRSVNWLAHDVRAESLGDDVRASLRPISTVFGPRAAGAAERLAAVAAGGSDPGAGDYAPDTRVGGWVFQGDPRRYDLLAAVNSGRTDEWNVNQRRDRVSVGDRVWFRLTGSEAGIYAVGRVASLPRYREETEFGPWAVDIVYEALVQPPLTSAEIAADPRLANVRPLLGAMGTNFVLDEATDERLAELLIDRLRPVRAGMPESWKSLVEVNHSIEQQLALVEKEIVEAIQEMSPDDFERLCRLLLQDLGFEEVRVTGARTAHTLGDAGIDLTARMVQAGLPPLPVRVQAKRQRSNVGPGPIQQLRGALRTAEQGVFMTASSFTRRAIEEAEEDGKTPIGLLSGQDLARRVIKSGLGVRVERVELPRFDPQAFHELVKADD